jgi:hypothetical protein
MPSLSVFCQTFTLEGALTEKSTFYETISASMVEVSIYEVEETKANLCKLNLITEYTCHEAYQFEFNISKKHLITFTSDTICIKVLVLPPIGKGDYEMELDINFLTDFYENIIIYYDAEIGIYELDGASFENFKKIYHISLNE